MEMISHICSMEIDRNHDKAGLALLLVEELRKQGALEDVICEYGIETVRECTHCHELMNEGWIFHDYETFCSDECLMCEHPDVDIKYLKEHASDEDSVAYWTAWEG